MSKVIFSLGRLSFGTVDNRRLGWIYLGESGLVDRNRLELNLYKYSLKLELPRFVKKEPNALVSGLDGKSYGVLLTFPERKLELNYGHENYRRVNLKDGGYKLGEPKRKFFYLKR